MQTRIHSIMASAAIVLLVVGLIAGCSKSRGIVLSGDTEAVIYASDGVNLVVLRDGLPWFCAEGKITPLVVKSKVPVRLDWGGGKTLIPLPDRSEILCREAIGTPVSNGVAMAEPGSDYYLSSWNVESGLVRRLCKIDSGIRRVMPNRGGHVVALSVAVSGTSPGSIDYELRVCETLEERTTTVTTVTKGPLYLVGWEGESLIWAVSSRNGTSFHQYNVSSGTTSRLEGCSTELAEYQVALLGSYRVLFCEPDGRLISLDLVAGTERIVATLKRGLYPVQVAVSGSGQHAIVYCHSSENERYSALVAVDTTSGHSMYLKETTDSRLGNLEFLDWSPLMDRVLLGTRTSRQLVVSSYDME